MKLRFFTTSAAVAAATLALTACADTSKPNVGANAPPALSAGEAFTDAVSKLKAASFKAELTYDGVAAIDRGLVTDKSTILTDPAGKKVHVISEGTAFGQISTYEAISIRKELWVRSSDMGGAPDKWLHVTSDKIKPGGGLDMPENRDELVDAVVTVQRDGATGYKGTIDLSKLRTEGAATLTRIGDKAKAVPFTATVDASGRLTRILVDIAAVEPGMGRQITTFSGFGDPITINPPPPSDVIEMPADLFEEMNKVQ